ncbi:hypothetical protein SP38_36 [Salmonella phage 38]|uniref:Uncharacterized protein n=1 Tax=Salmonella phage 38 TaxID=1654891 RepID=A0A0N7C9F3_9CAUD|nr:hypothetical protein SP38_36 [Salmonella phage 38]AKJ73638.1 hypothetical protein SP38_36 [Salmonella phage 38]
MKTFLEFYRESTLPDFTNIVLYHGSNVEFDIFDLKNLARLTLVRWVLGFT